MDKREKFTPGPWIIRPYGIRGGLLEIRQLSGIGIPSVTDATFMAHEPEEAANANLVAAAPDMYAALAIVRSVLEVKKADGHKVSGLINTIDIALAKARGET